MEETRLVEAFFESQERRQSDPELSVSESLWQGIAIAIEEAARVAHMLGADMPLLRVALLL